MHIQSAFAETRVPVLHELIRSYPLATFVSSDQRDISADHFPLVLTAEGQYGVLRGHIPRTNPLARRLDGSGRALAIFQGPAAYISPGWYPTKRQHGRVVPTWNYVVVHATGTPRLISDPEWLLAHLNQLTDQQERAFAIPWALSDAPEEFINTMLQAIVGIEMPISLLQGKWKVSQNRSEADRAGVMRGLRSRTGANDAAMADLVAQRLAAENSQGDH